MNKTAILLAIAAISTSAFAQVPGMPPATSQAAQSAEAAPFQPGHRGTAPATNRPESLTPTVAARPAEPVAPTTATGTQHQSVSTSSGSPAAPAQTSGGASSSGGRSGVTETVAELDAQLIALAELQRRTEGRRAELELLNTEQQIDEVRRQSMGTRTGLSEVPQLVGIMSSRDGVVAEFLAGGAILHVAQGEMVSPEWRLERINRNSVEIRRNGRGNERHLLMFGGSARTP